MLATLLSSAGNHALLKGPVGDETLDLVYGGVCVVVGAVALKLAGMRAIAAAGRGEGFAALDKPVGVLVPPCGQRTSRGTLWKRWSRFSCCTLLTCARGGGSRYWDHLRGT